MCAIVAGPAQAVDVPVFSISSNSGVAGDKVTLSGTGCNSVGPHLGNIFAYKGVKSVPVGQPPSADGLLGGSTMVADDGTGDYCGTGGCCGSNSHLHGLADQVLATADPEICTVGRMPRIYEYAEPTVPRCGHLKANLQVTAEVLSCSSR